MKKILSWTALTLALLCFVPIPASASDSIVRATLKNGLRVVIVRNILAPVVTTEINYLVGGNETPPGFPGMAHAQEHMMFRGSPGLSAAQLSTIIAFLGGEFNAETQQTVTQYFFTVPAEDLDIALQIESVRMRGILDSDPLWDQERGAIEQEVAQDLSNPTYVFETDLLQQLYAGTPYAHDPLGSRESFDKTTGAMLKKFYDDWYAPNNAVLVIVGDIDPDAALSKVKELFESIPARPVPKRPEVTLKPLKPDMLKFDTDLPYGLAVVAYRLPGFDSPDYVAGQILADVLDSHRGDLYNLAVSGKALDTGFESDALPKAASGYAYAAFPKGADGSKLIKQMKEIIAGYLKNGVPGDLVEAAKRHELSDYEFQKNSVPGLASLWSMAVAVEGRNSPDDDIDAVKRVTAADVNRVAREYLTNGNAITALLLPKLTTGPAEMKEYKGPESFKPKQVQPVQVPEWAKKVIEPPSLPALHEHPTDMTLPNGLRLIVEPAIVSDTISITGMVKTNSAVQEPAGKEGVSQIMESLFSYGTTSLDRVAYQQALDEIGASVSVGSAFALRVLSDHFDRGIALLADNLLHPAFPAQAFSIVKQQTADSVKGELESPSYQVHHSLDLALYGKNDPSVRQATPETVSRLTLDDVKSYYGEVFRPDLTTIVVIGKITPQQAKAEVEKYFGSWKATGPRPKTDLPPAALNKPASTVVPDPSRVQDEVRLVEVMELTRKNPDYYALQVGNHVLSGAFYATRLYRDLREKAGLVYTVESLLQVRKTRSLFAVFYACDPPNVGKARALVEGELQDMQKSLITPEELRQTKALLVRGVPLSLSSTDSIAGELLNMVQEELPLDEPRRAAKRYLDMTVQDVKNAFTKWIRPGQFVQVTLGPPPK